MKKIIIIFFAFFIYTSVFSYVDKDERSGRITVINTREDCVEGTEMAIQNINNVRATLLSSGDVWWNLQQGQYFVPNTPPEIQDVSSLFAGSVWIGGFEPIEGGEDILKIAATTYRPGGDWYPGPLDDETGTSDSEVCARWDRFFEVTGDEIDLHRLNFNRFRQAGLDYPKDSIPDNVRFYPGLGNVDFPIRFGFQLPDAGQGLGAFFDHPDSQLDVYDPENGDFPVIEVRGCSDFGPQYPDQMFFWIYNDQAGPHMGTMSTGTEIQMEVQVQAFGYESNDELNDMTFQRYKLINRAQTVITDCYFAMWVDGDLGCSEDDFIGCDTTRSMAILYNQDELDGDDGITCSTGAATYGQSVPILGVDYFRGPLKPQNFDDNGNLIDLTNPFAEPDTFIEIGMTSFVYTNRAGAGEHPIGTTDAQTAQEHYNLLDGLWRDGLPITQGGSGYNINSTDTIRFVLPDRPNDDNGWSMCSADLGFGDRRTIQASGPFTLKQGAVNELIIGIAWVPNQVYPCPELGELNKADDLAQALFDNCFQTLDGPKGPDVDVVELNREIILLLSNDTLLSNNAFEEYSEVDIFATDSIAQSLPDGQISYKFEGYLIYQLFDPNASSTLDDIERARLVRNVDVTNGVTTLYNWNSQVNPLPGNNELVFTPERRVTGADNGIVHSFSITEDAFNQGDTRLINHKEYYFFVIAYGFNEYAPFDPQTGLGQQRPFISGRQSFGVVTVVPRPIVYDQLNTFYGDGPKITRISGVGNQGKFLLLEDGMHDEILANNVVSEVEYKDNFGPLEVKIVNPIDVKDGRFRLEVLGEFDEDDGRMLPTENSRWRLTDLESNDEFVSIGSLEQINERIIREYGFSLTIFRQDDVSDNPDANPGAGTFVGATIEYDDPNGPSWLGFTPPSGIFQGIPPFYRAFYSYLDTDDAAIFDPSGEFSDGGGTNMVPLKLANFTTPIITPALRQNQGLAGTVQATRLSMADLNNVDLVFTSDRSKWSKCIVVETAHRDFFDLGYEAQGEAVQLEIKDQPSLALNADGDGNPTSANDGTVGFGYFPGYAIDVETGQRLNIFYGENSVYGDPNIDDTPTIGRDMAWNPNSQLIIPTPQGRPPGIYDAFTGAQHTIYVTRTEYDECASLVELFEVDALITRVLRGLATITWTGIPMPTQDLLSYGDGVIPNDATVRLRVDNTFGRALADDEGRFEPTGDSPVYEFELNGKQAIPVDGTTIDEALDNVGVVPNPYYAVSSYEIQQNDTRVLITNVPAKSTITIYSFDGRFITQFRRDAIRNPVNRPTASVNFSQEGPNVVWDLTNNAGIPVSSGVYIFTIVDEETGAQKSIKWFGINRKFDPSGL